MANETWKTPRLLRESNNVDMTLSLPWLSAMKLTLKLLFYVVRPSGLISELFWCVMLSQNNDKTATRCRIHFFLRNLILFLPLRLDLREKKLRIFSFFFVKFNFSTFIELSFHHHVSTEIFIVSNFYGSYE